MDSRQWQRSLSRALPGRARLLDVALGPHWRGTGDPCLRRLAGVWWRATRTPYGPGLQRCTTAGDDLIVECWGPGREWLAEQAPRLFGADDQLDGFDPARHPIVAQAHRRFAWLRLGRTSQLLEALAPAALEQVVTNREAFRAHRLVALRFAAPVPLPDGHPAAGIRLPLSAEQWLAVPSWELLRAGVEQRRAQVVRSAAQASRSLQRLAAPGFAGDPDQALRSLPGIGPWTSAQVRQRALGDSDAWSVGDYHVGGQITYALTGEVLDDDAAEQLLEPFAGHRYRVERLLGLAGLRPPRHGPRRTLPTHLPT